MSRLSIGRSLESRSIDMTTTTTATPQTAPGTNAPTTGQPATSARAISAPDARRPRRISGFQPTGSMHLGNYLGAIRPMVADQDRTESIVFIADLHALT